MHVTGPWSHSRVGAFLGEAQIPLRLACVTQAGWPLVLSLWYVHLDGQLWCATPASARVVAHLEARPRCGFEVAVNDPPYRGVRGTGLAHIDHERGREMLRTLAERYLGPGASPFKRWLLERPVQEVAIRIDVERLSSWDFTERMGAQGS